MFIQVTKKDGITVLVSVMAIEYIGPSTDSVGSLIFWRRNTDDYLKVTETVSEVSNLIDDAIVRMNGGTVYEV